MIKLKTILEAKKDSYSRIKTVWNAANKKVPLKSLQDLAKLFKEAQKQLDDEFKEEFPKGAFTHNQLYMAIFGGVGERRIIRDNKEILDYLNNIISKKLGKK